MTLAKGSFTRSDFGMNAYIPVVGDEVNVEAEANFLKNLRGIKKAMISK